MKSIVLAFVIVASGIVGLLSLPLKFAQQKTCLANVGCRGLAANTAALVRSEQARVRIGNNDFSLDVSRSQVELSKGLGNRMSLGANEGMLFVFDAPDLHKFWMKDMNFAIDIIWVDSDKRVVTIKSDVRPESYPESFAPARNALYVIEIAAGRAAEVGLREGDQLSW